MGFFDQMRSAGEAAAQAGQQHLTEQKIARQVDEAWESKADYENNEEKEVAKQTRKEVSTYNKEQRQREREEAKAKRLEAREARKIKRQETIANIKQGISEGIQRSKDLGKQVGEGVRTARDIFIGITQTEAGKQAVKEAVQSGIQEGLEKIAETANKVKEWTGDRRDIVLDFISEKQDHLQRGMENLRQSAIAKKDQLVTQAKDKIEETREILRQEVIEPIVDHSKAIGKATVNGVKTAGLFTAGLAIQGYESGVQGIKYVAEKTKEGANIAKDFTVEQYNNAVDKATEWKNNLVASIEKQADIFSRNIQAEYNIVQASFADIKAAPRELLSKFSGKLAERLSGISQRNIEAAQAHRTKSETCRTVAETLRSGQSAEVNA